MKIIDLMTFGALVALGAPFAAAQNPLIQTKYTADPAPMVYNDTIYHYSR